MISFRRKKSFSLWGIFLISITIHQHNLLRLTGYNIIRKSFVFGTELSFANQNVDTYEYKPDSLKIGPAFHTLRCSSIKTFKFRPNTSAYSIISSFSNLAMVFCGILASGELFNRKSVSCSSNVIPSSIQSASF